MKTNHVSVHSIVVVPKGGADITEVRREVVSLALELKCDVEYIFSGNKFICRYCNVMLSVEQVSQ